jgi:hypothetical protein
MTSTNHTRIRPATIIASLAIVLGAWLALAGNAHAVGQITYDGCVANDASQGCADIPAAPLDGASGVAVSTDGKSVYATAIGSSSVAHLFRGGSDGQISYDGCLANTGAQGCLDLAADPLTSARKVAVSPDGKSVYVVSGEGVVAHFFRSTTGGQISYDGCVSNDGSQGCADIPGPGTPLAGANDVAVSPDGKSVYVSSAVSDSVSHFFRSTVGGQISYDGCVANDASQGCADIPAAPLDGAAEVAVSPDGKSVYVASFFSDSVAHFFRGGPDGQISYDGCVANDASQGCADVPAAPLIGAIDVAVSPDNKSVYVSSAVSDSVSHFFRAVDPDPTPDPDPNPDPNADKSPPQTTIDKGPKRKTTRQATTIRFSSDEPGSRFECKLDKGKFKPCSSPRKVKRLRKGKHRFVVRAIDPAGNVDPSPAKLRWRIVN